MLKILLKVIAVIALVVLGILVFVKALPWLIGIVAVVGVIIEGYHLWLRSKLGGGGTPRRHRSASSGCAVGITPAPKP
jgi:hypothetical protein